MCWVCKDVKGSLSVALHPQEKPTPAKEAHQGLNIVSESLWHSVPNFLRTVDLELKALAAQENINEFEQGLPVQVAPVKFASWMGGDRDGNPFVTADVTKDISIRNRIAGAKLVIEAVNALGKEITVRRSKATQELLDCIDGALCTCVLLCGCGSVRDALFPFHGQAWNTPTRDGSMAKRRASHPTLRPSPTPSSSACSSTDWGEP